MVKPHATITDHPALDILLVPGGDVWTREVSNPAVLDWIRRQDQQTKLTTNVCTGAFLLAECGLLNRRRATTHWTGAEQMRQQYPAVKYWRIPGSSTRGVSSPRRESPRASI